MEKTTFDLQRLCHWGVDKALAMGEARTGLPLGEIISPIAKQAITSLALAPLEIDPITMILGKLVLAGIDRQAKISQARREQDAGRTRDS